NAALIPQMTGASDLKLQALKAALSYNFQFNQACAKVFVVGTSLAIILWSITLSRFGVLERRIGIIGWVISLAALFGLLSGHVYMFAHGFGLIVSSRACFRDRCVEVLMSSAVNSTFADRRRSEEVRR